MGKYISTKAGLKTLLKRYKAAGVNDQTKDITNSYPAFWLTTIQGCINEGLAMDEVDYQNTPKELRKLWAGLK